MRLSCSNIPDKRATGRVLQKAADFKISRAPAVKKGLLCILLFLSSIAAIHSQDARFGWSFGNFGWTYDFIGRRDISDVDILKFFVEFEQINLVASASLLSGTGKNNRTETEPFYNSFLPLEISYSPFKWKYAHLAVYGRGAWEIGYTGDIADPDMGFSGFFGSAGFKAGLFPMKPNIFRYRAYLITLFSEYTTHNEFKMGASLDLFYIVYAVVKLQSIAKKTEDSAY
jgi:hypothetical protein